MFSVFVTRRDYKKNQYGFLPHNFPFKIHPNIGHCMSCDAIEKVPLNKQGLILVRCSAIRTLTTTDAIKTCCHTACQGSSYASSLSQSTPLLHFDPRKHENICPLSSLKCIMILSSQSINIRRPKFIENFIYSVGDRNVMKMPAANI